MSKKKPKPDPVKACEEAVTYALRAILQLKSGKPAARLIRQAQARLAEAA